MYNRIKLIREDAGMSMKKFGEAIGISDGAVAKLEKQNGNTPSEQTRRAICERFHINRVWLETGEGEMKQPVDEFGVLVRQLWPEATDRVVEFLRRVNETPGGMERLVDTLDALSAYTNTPKA